MKRDKKGIEEELVKWINRIVSKEKEKDKDKKHRDNHLKNGYLTKLPLIPQKTSMIKFLVLFFLHGPEDHEINKQNMSTALT